MPPISKASLRRHHRRLPIDKNLLNVVLMATLVITVTMVVIPLTMDNGVVMEEMNSPSTKQKSGQSEILRSSALDGPGNQGGTEKLLGKKGADPLREKVADTKGTASRAIITDPDASSEKNEPITGVTYHTVFSTGCSTFQDWQSYVFFYHMLHSGQEGPVTRIASGCEDDAAKELEDIFANEIAVMAPDRFRLHLTPDFSKVKGQKKFKYYNKPCGMRHWMENALGYPDSRAHDNTIIILLDPDQILLRPFTNDFTHSSERWRLKDDRVQLKVEHGSPFSQQYGYGIQWKRKVTPTKVFQGETPISNMTDKEAMDFYSGMGPPYVATGKDMYTIVNTWASIVPRVHDEYPHLLAEMFAYNLAAAHHGLRHTISHSFQVSDIWAGGEGWKLIDKVPDKDICYNFPKTEYPHVIHYCQRYFVGKWFIGKYKLRKDFISCQSPLLTLPPEDLPTKYNSSTTPNNVTKDLTPKQAKEEAFMVCTMIQALNDAAVYYKKNHCNSTANFDYTYTFHEDMRMPYETTR